ncbi:hypothetical protein LguiB_013639 [Lonicera macranthoides]
MSFGQTYLLPVHQMVPPSFIIAFPKKISHQSLKRLSNRHRNLEKGKIIYGDTFKNRLYQR